MRAVYSCAENVSHDATLSHYDPGIFSNCSNVQVPTSSQATRDFSSSGGHHLGPGRRSGLLNLACRIANLAHLCISPTSSHHIPHQRTTLCHCRMNILIACVNYIDLLVCDVFKVVGGLDRCSFRTRYHTQVPEISGKLNGKKSAFTWATSLRSLGAEQLEPPRRIQSYNNESQTPQTCEKTPSVAHFSTVEQNTRRMRGDV
jgi:hypothetical protein